MSKEITMSINQFMNIQRGNLKLNNNLENIAGKILKNTKFKKIVLITAVLINMNIVAYANENTTEAIAQIENAEGQIVPVLLAIIGAICTICCIAQIGKSVITNKGQDIGQIVMKFIMAFCGACAVPWLFRLIRNMFTL